MPKSLKEIENGSTPKARNSRRKAIQAMSVEAHHRRTTDRMHCVRCFSLSAVAWMPVQDETNYAAGAAVDAQNAPLKTMSMPDETARRSTRTVPHDQGRRRALYPHLRHGQLHHQEDAQALGWPGGSLEALRAGQWSAAAGFGNYDVLSIYKIVNQGSQYQYRLR